MKTENRSEIAIVLLTVILTLTAWLPAHAEQQKTTQSMDDMVVTATRTKEWAIDVPVVTEVITQEKIEMSGATHIGDLIGKYMTGHYHKYTGLLSPVGLRGFRTDSTATTFRAMC